ncbi:MAG: hypothetical protein ABI304_02120 [Rudaea sp.]
MRPFALFFFATLTCAAHANGTFEPEPFLQAATLVQPVFLSGPNFTVVPEVQVRGYMADFLIDTKFGPVHADSVQMLAIRVAEIPALEILDRASHTGAFAGAIAQSGAMTGNALLTVATHPIATLTGLPAGVARYLVTQWDSWSGRAQSLSDRASKKFENVGDPYNAPIGPMTAERRAALDPTDPVDAKNRAWYARVGTESKREIKRQVKFSSQRRELAKVLGVDPDTSNPLLRERLDTLAWAAAWGGFSAGQALGQIGGTAATVISDSGKLNQYVWTKTPEQLREINQKRLLAFCSDEYTVRQFLRRGGFTDSLRTSLADALDKLQPEHGCNELLELATTTHGEVEARFIVDALKQIETETNFRGGSLLIVGAGIAWRMPSGKLILPLPVDYLSWNHNLAAFFDLPELRNTNKTVLIGGQASMLAQQQLTERGWSINLHVAYDGSPAYVRAIEFNALSKSEIRAPQEIRKTY